MKFNSYFKKLIHNYSPRHNKRKHIFNAKHKIISLMLCAVITAASGFSAFATSSDFSELDGSQAATLVRQAVSLVQQDYRFDTTNEQLYKNALIQVLKDHPEVIESAFSGIFDNLDEFSRYFTEEELNAFYSSLSGEVCGIGVLITEFNEGLLVTSVYAGSPAEEVGIKTGDIITTADGTNLVGQEFNIAKSYITGDEGTYVKVGFVRNGVYMEKDVERKKITVESGEYYTLENNKIGYIKLYSFDEHAGEFVKKALGHFNKYNVTDIIFDLRNNPGGSLYVLLDICKNFIPKGPVVHIDYANSSKSFSLDSDNEKPKYSLIVLMNEYSASAAEAFAGAVQDTGVGIVLGTQSYGKGTMQNVTKFRVGGGIKLTEAYYLTPNKRNINNIGIEPDLVIHEKMVAYKDADLKPVTYERILDLDDVGDDVIAIKQRLKLLGYNVDDKSDIYDEQTYYTVMKFQENEGLFPYGVMDLTTQVQLENLLLASKLSDNSTFNTAVEIFKTKTMDEHKHEWLPKDTSSPKDDDTGTGNLTMN